MNMLIDAILLLILVYFVIRFCKIGLMGIFLGVGRLLLSLSASVLFGAYLSRLVILNYAERWISGPLATIFSLAISYIIVFAATYLLSSLIIGSLRRSEKSIFSKIDKIGGAIVGFMIGIGVDSVISGVIGSLLNVAYTLSGKSSISDVMNNTVLYKFLFEFSVFDLVKNLL